MRGFKAGVMKLRRKLASYWLSYAPMWLWYPMNKAGSVWSRLTYRAGMRGAVCREWSAEHCELLQNGCYRVRFCEEPKGHPKSMPHKCGVYEWKD